MDYDSQREFDASNQLALWYEGKPGERLRRVELGNVSFAAPASRFLGASVPAGNYGLQAEAQLGPLRLQAIAAQQKGNVVRDRQFVIGDRALQSGEHEIEDWQIEPRRFFFAVNPRALPGYPAIDILDRAQLAAARAALPDTLRPTRLRVYRLQFGAPPQNPSGPRFLVQEEGVRRATGAQTYDVLREGVDYYADPSLLWFALVRPLNGANERLVVAYDVRVNGVDRRWVTTGGTPDIEATAGEQVATLVWDPNVTPQSPAFAREIRSVYRIGGPDLVRERTQVRVVAGAGDQEKPLAGTAETYLQMLGLAQPTNSAEFDVEQRLWPRRGDPVFNQSAGAGAAGAPAPLIVGDHFLVFPSLRPFAARGGEGGRIEAGNPANVAVYETPGEYLAFGSPRHPTSVYRIRVRTETEGSPDRASLMLGGVQLRRGSERIVVDGVQLVRDVDYRLDYELGQVTFTRPDTLFARPRTVSVRYEENPLFAATPTRLAGLTGEWTFPRGQLAFTAVSQAQSSAFTRPELGFERAAATTAGLTGRYALPLAPLDRALSRLPWGATTASSRLQVQGELALSRPEGRDRQQAYVESFEGEGGVQIGLQDAGWLLSSLPAYGRGEVARRWSGQLEPDRAAPLAWQTFVEGPDGRARTFTLQQIDPQAEVSGLGAATAPETLLWLTLRPFDCGLTDAAGRCAWPLASGPTGTRWRSIRTSLGAGGRDLSLAEQLEFWALVDTTLAGRARNPTLLLDLGEVSENSLAFAPETLTVRHTGRALDSLYSGRRVEGFDRLDSERDPFTRAFDAAKNDRGLPGDRADSLVVVDGASVRTEKDVVLCRGAERTVRAAGDTRADCTAGNGRLDEEDIDLDGALNITNARREDEQLLRYVIDLGDPSRYARIGRSATVIDTVDGRPLQVTKQWVLVRVPFGAPHERVNDVLLRRVRALRLTMISGRALGDGDPSTVALARMRLVAAPWVKRADGPVTGVAGDRRGPGFGVTTVIGTNDRDSTRGLVYEPPPGVSDQAETVNGQLQTGATQINERSLRVLAGGLEPWHRVEAYHRFSAGQQSFMGYRELRLWARGRGEGWGPNGELQFF
ncbi:MAG: cell surface protein SprA, partial [Gemmatimonadaceae bacterium]